MSVSRGRVATSAEISEPIGNGVTLDSAQRRTRRGRRPMDTGDDEESGVQRGALAGAGDDAKSEGERVRTGGPRARSLSTRAHVTFGRRAP
jgi:hypothetical protein